MNTYKKSETSKKVSQSKDYSKDSKIGSNKSYNNKNRSKYKGKGKTSNYHEDDLPNKDCYDNNPDWYIIDQTTADQASGFSFANFIGEPVNIQGCKDSLITSTYNTVDIGSIMQIGLNPSLGTVGMDSDAKVSAINQQGFKMYSRLSSVNSKNTQYLPNDITTLILAVGELIKMISWGQRAFGLSWVYNLRNRNMPKVLINKAGFDPDDFYGNLAQYRIKFNTLMVQANKIPFPSNINYFNKCAQVYSSIYKDDVTDMSQMYVFIPASTWIIDETGENGTILKTTYLPDLPSNGMVFSEYLALLESMINTLLTSATYNYVYADIVNFAAKNSGKVSMSMLNFGTIPEDYVVLPEYNEPILSQIHNMTILGTPIIDKSSTNNMYIATYDDSKTETFTQSNDVIPDVSTLSMFYKPAFGNDHDAGTDGFAAYVRTSDKILDFHTSSPDTGMRLEATRLTSGCNKVNHGKIGDQTTWIASDLVSADNYVVFVRVTSRENVSGYTLYNSGIAVNDSGLMESFSVYCLGYLTQFKERPMWYIGDTTGASIAATKAEIKSVYADLDFFTTVEMSTLKRINDLSLYGLFEPKDFEYGGVISGK